MANLLRVLILLMLVGISLTAAVALNFINFPLTHIHLAIITFLYTIFAQAFVMFYFIGVARLIENVHTILHSGGKMDELFDEPPTDIKPYKEKVVKFVADTKRCKRQTIPWTMLMLTLGTIAFLLGGAHDTGMVDKTIHSGVVYGFLAAMLIGFVRQWYYLGVGHKTLRKIKGLFQIPDAQM
jgi:hypothetical protein